MDRTITLTIKEAAELLVCIDKQLEFLDINCGPCYSDDKSLILNSVREKILNGQLKEEK